MELKYFPFTLKSIPRRKGVYKSTHMCMGMPPTHTCAHVRAHIHPCTHMHLPIQLHRISTPRSVSVQTLTSAAETKCVLKLPVFFQL